ncbi:type IV secretory system conjugative DNA transfer family protein [Aggregatibacter kilianii]|uniref:type IV secretory system conjugative DNA transfer family protein n=1 Tax=Aggregatibacter kilianii TaxID=2025884 RepID=UPI000D69A48A|nr:type IV secretory system conjugative DNA transfer family protein [Aggregatibacter kilianii]
MNELDKKKKLVLLLLALFGTVGAAVYGCSTASELAYSWLKIGYESKLTSIFSLISAVNDATPPKAKAAIFGATALGAVIAIAPLIFIGVVIWGLKPKEELYGSARFATDLEIKKSGLLPTPAQRKESKYPSILIGKYKGQYLHFAGQQFLYLSAPTRSGKGVGIVIPNLLNYSDSVVCVDIKLENFFFTAGFREKCGQKVFLFSPDGFAESEEARQNGQIKSHHYNPLHYIRRDMKYRDGDVQKIVDILFPPNGKDPWNALAGNLGKGLICYLLDIEQNEIKRSERNFRKLAEIQKPTIPLMMSLGAGKGGYKGFMERAMREHEDGENELSEATRTAFNEFLGTHDSGQSSVMMTFNAQMKVYTNPTCAAALSDNDFDFEDLRKQRMSIYVGLSPDGLVTYSRLINLFFSQLIMVNTRVLPDQDKNLKYQCLLVLDEFPALGAVNILADAIGFTAGYNVRYLIIVQDHSQLCSQELYGKERANNLRKNCMIRVIYPPKEVDENTKEISETLGYKTVKKKEESRTYSDGKTSKTVNNREQQRALMLPQEIVDLGTINYKNTSVALKEIIIMEKVKPFIADKIIYFDEAVFQERKDYSVKNIPAIPLLFNN